MRLDARLMALDPGQRQHAIEALLTVADLERGRKLSAPSTRSMVWVDEATPAHLFPVIDGVAVISIRGCLVDSLPYIGAPWATGYNCLRVQIGAAMVSPDVRGIVYDLDSPGGYADGLFDLTDWIEDCRAEWDKPVAAIVRGMATSAAYAIACTADSIAVSRLGAVGSVGCFLMHSDMTKMLEDWGLKLTVIRAGLKKAQGMPFEPLADDVRAEWQDDIEATRSLFAETVARLRARAGTSLSVEQVLATEARSYSGVLGTAEAVKLGLADAVIAPDKAFAAFAAHLAASA